MIWFSSIFPDEAPGGAYVQLFPRSADGGKLKGCETVGSGEVAPVFTDALRRAFARTLDGHVDVCLRRRDERGIRKAVTLSVDDAAGFYDAGDPSSPVALYGAARQEGEGVSLALVGLQRDVTLGLLALVNRPTPSHAAAPPPQDGPVTMGQLVDRLDAVLLRQDALTEMVQALTDIIGEHLPALPELVSTLAHVAEQVSALDAAVSPLLGSLK